MLTSLFSLFTSLVSVTGSYTEDEPNILIHIFLVFHLSIKLFLCYNLKMFSSI